MSDYRSGEKTSDRTYSQSNRGNKQTNTGNRRLFWGLVLIAFGLLFLLSELGLISGGSVWVYGIISLGAVFIIQSVVFNLSRETRSYTAGRLIPGIILLFIGMAFLFGFNVWWPLALIATGTALFFSSWILQREIEKRKLTQETLQQSEAKYRNLVENANSIIMEMDTSGNIVYINPFGRDFFGYTEEELLGRNVIGSIVPEYDSSGKDLKELIADITSQPDKYVNSENENMRRNGEKVWVAWSNKGYYSSDNNLTHILCTGIDRTMQKQAAEFLAEQSRNEAALAERTRLARDLHDAVSQTLFSASLIADVLPRLWEKDKMEGAKRLEEVRLLTRGALAEMRTLLFELRPAALVDAELSELLRQLCESVTGRARVPVALEVEGDCNSSSDVKIAFYRIAQEALNNIAKHSAASRAQVALHCEPHKISLDITDNGKGFDVTNMRSGSFGLNNMKERANHVGADIDIKSKINEGTEIMVVWEDREE